MDPSYLSDILLKNTQLQALMEAEFTVLPHPLHLLVTLQMTKSSRESTCLSAGHM